MRTKQAFKHFHTAPVESSHVLLSALAPTYLALLVALNSTLTYFLIHLTFDLWFVPAPGGSPVALPALSIVDLNL